MFVVPHEGHRPECGPGLPGQALPGQGPTEPVALPVWADDALLHFVS